MMTMGLQSKARQSMRRMLSEQWMLSSLSLPMVCLRLVQINRLMLQTGCEASLQ